MFLDRAFMPRAVPLFKQKRLNCGRGLTLKVRRGIFWMDAFGEVQTSKHIGRVCRDFLASAVAVPMMRLKTVHKMPSHLNRLYMRSMKSTNHDLNAPALVTVMKK